MVLPAVALLLDAEPSGPFLLAKPSPASALDGSHNHRSPTSWQALCAQNKPIWSSTCQAPGVDLTTTMPLSLFPYY